MYTLMVLGLTAFISMGLGLFLLKTKNDTGFYFLGYGLAFYGIFCSMPQLWATKSSTYTGWRLNLLEYFYISEFVLGWVALIIMARA